MKNYLSSIIYHLSFNFQIDTLKNQWKMKNDKYQIRESGFTLIELLAAMAALIVIGSIIAAILVNTLRGGNKTQSISIVRQNGEYALLQMSKMIRSARSFDGVSNNGTTFTTCESATVGAGTPTPAVPPIDDQDRYKAIKVGLFDGGEVIFSCTATNVTPPSSIASTSALSNPQTVISLLDTSVVTIPTGDDGQPVCYFTCFQSSASDYPTIGIVFSLEKKNQSAAIAESTASLSFQTTVAARNINR